MNGHVKQQGSRLPRPTAKELGQFEIVFVAFGPDPELHTPEVSDAYHKWVDPVVKYISEHFGLNQHPFSEREGSTHHWIVKYNRWCRKKYDIQWQLDEDKP